MNGQNSPQEPQEGLQERPAALEWVGGPDTPVAIVWLRPSLARRWASYRRRRRVRRLGTAGYWRRLGEGDRLD